MNRISLCMIVRNEADIIERCLQNIGTLVDEIIIVDTGSTDRTVDVCKSYGANIYKFNWKNDFSSARNESLAHASGEWILVLDADDELPVESHLHIRRLVNEEPYDAFFFTTKNLVGDAQHPTILNYAQLRLFRSNLNFRYSGAIHELIPKVTSVKYKVVPSIFVIHRGYLDTMVQHHKKIYRNLSILDTELMRRPMDISMYYYKGNEFLRAGKFTDAIHYYKQATTLERSKDQTPWLPELPSKYAYALWQMGDIKSAIEVIQQAIRDSPEYTDLWLLLGILYLNQQHMDLAREAFSKCLQLGEPSPIYPTQEGCGTYLPAFFQGVISLTDKNITDARADFEESCKYNSNYVPAAIQLCLCDWIEKKFESVHKRTQQLRKQNFNEWTLDLLDRINESLMMKQIHINTDDPNHVASFLTCLSTLSLNGQTSLAAQLLCQLPLKIHVTAMKEDWYYELLGEYHLTTIEVLKELDA